MGVINLDKLEPIDGRYPPHELYTIAEFRQKVEAGEITGPGEGWYGTPQAESDEQLHEYDSSGDIRQPILDHPRLTHVIWRPRTV